MTRNLIASLAVVTVAALIVSSGPVEAAKPPVMRRSAVHFHVGGPPVVHTRTHMVHGLAPSLVTHVHPPIYVRRVPIISPVVDVIAAHEQTPLRVDDWWRSEIGELRLWQNGTFVNGRLELKDGRRIHLEGRLVGDEIVFDWLLSKAVHGDGSLRLSGAGTRLYGTYTNRVNGATQDWVLVRQ